MEMCNNCNIPMIKSSEPKEGTQTYTYVCPQCGQDMEKSD